MDKQANSLLDILIVQNKNDLGLRIEQAQNWYITWNYVTLADNISRMFNKNTDLKTIDPAVDDFNLDTDKPSMQILRELENKRNSLN